MERAGDLPPGPRALSNPLLSTAVTGLRLQDLNHHAVLLPALEPDSQNNRPQNAPPKDAAPTGPPRAKDLNANQLPPAHARLESKPPTTSIHKQDVGHKHDLGPRTTVSKASAKTEDDFDVNEYFARLQSTRYVSAPLNSQIGDDTSANLEESEGVLEEVNLAESPVADIQQSLTADIAQNFSQLPQVLPQVASAVFSSFSSILSLSKGREESSDAQCGQGDYGYGRAAVRQSLEGYAPESEAVPMFSADSVREIGRPPAVGEERPAIAGPPPVGGATNTFRMTNKKKTYANIPGLSTSGTHPAPQMAAFNVNLPPKPASDQMTAAPPYYSPSFYSPTAGPTILDSNMNLSSAATDVTKDSTSSSAVMTEITEAQLTNVLPSVGESRVLDVIASQGHAFVSQALDVTDCSGIVKNSSGKEQADYENLMIKENVNIDLFSPSGLENNSSAVSWTPHNLRPTESLPPIGNLPPAGVWSPNTTTSGFLPSTLPPSLSTPQFGNLPTSESLPSVGFTPAFGSLPNAKGFHQTESVPPPIPTPVGTLPPSIGLPYPENLPSSVNLPSTGTAMLPPTGVLPPTGNFPPRSMAINRSVMPPSVARKLCNAPNISQTSKPTEAEPKIFVPPPPNSTLQSEDAPMAAFSGTSGHQAFTPSFYTENTQRTPREDKETLNEFNVTSTEVSGVINTPLLPPSFGGFTHSEIMIDPSQNAAPKPPTLFNPLSFEQQVGVLSTPTCNISQAISNNPNDALNQLSENTTVRPPPIEPPKIPPSGHNFRLGNKKRPQYYSGPIDSAGHVPITGKANVTPGFPMQGSDLGNISLFTPSMDQSENTQEVSTDRPFDVHQKQEMFEVQANVMNMPYHVNQSQHQAYDTPFDLSRPHVPQYNSGQPFGFPTTESNVGGPYREELQQEETKPVALLGSLKSKLSSVNINKLQSAVTSFFDPAYYEPEKKENLYDSSTTNFSYGTQPNNEVNFNYGPIHGPDSQNFEIAVQDVDYNAQYQQLSVHSAHSPYNYQSSIDAHHPPYSYDQNYGQQNYIDNNVTTFTPALPEQEALPTGHYSNVIQHRYGQNVEDFTENSNNVQSSFSEYQKELPGCSDLKETMTNAPSVLTKGNSDVSTFTYDSTLDIYNQFGKKDNNEEEAQFDQFGKIDNNAEKAKFANELRKESAEQNAKTTLDSFASQNPNDFFGPHCDSSAIVGPKEIKNTESFFHVEKNIKPMKANTDERRSSVFGTEDNGDRKPGAITTQLIENMTAPIQLINPVEVPFTESSAETDEYNRSIDTEQFKEISQITEETIETIQIQSSIELLEKDDDINITNQETNMFFDEVYGSYAWSIKADSETTEIQESSLGLECSPTDNNSKAGLKDDPFNVPRNASDEIKAELKHVSQEDLISQKTESLHNFLPRQMSIPTAPPIELLLEDIVHQPAQKSIDIRSGVLDINLIEQDAKADYPELDPYIIEPSETDDDKLESYKDRDNLEELSTLTHETADVFNIIQNINKAPSLIEEPAKPVIDINTKSTSPIYENVHKLIGPAVTFASYFDTGNYAAENYFKNVQISQNCRKNSLGKTDTSDKKSLSNSQINYGKPEFSDNLMQTKNTEMVLLERGNTETTTEGITELPNLKNHFQSTEKPLRGFTESEQYDLQESDHKERSILLQTTGVIDDVKLPQPSNFLNLEDIATSQNTSVDANLLSTEIIKIITPDSTSTTKDAIETNEPLEVFSNSAFETKIKEVEESANAKQSFNLLASYFTNPPETGKTQSPDPQKSFFELSEGQDHYMHRTQAPVTTPSKPYLTDEEILETSFQVNDNLTNKNNVNNEDKSHRTKSFFELSQSENHYIDSGAVPGQILNGNVEAVPSSQHINIDRNKLINFNIQYIPDVQPQFINSNNKTTIDIQKVYKSDLENSPTDQFNSTSNKAEYYELNADTNVENIDYKCQPKDITYSFTTEINNGAEIEESFTDYESRLAAIIYNCEHCSVKLIDNKTVDLENGVTNLGVKSYRHSEAVCVGEVMEADGVGKEKGGGGVNLRTNAESTGRGARASVGFEDVQEEDYQEDSDLARDNVAPGQYQAVRHHWFYRLDREGKSVWKPFSAVDSDALEEAHCDPALNEKTLVPTDGGRYDVSLVARLRSPVYWTEKPTDVMRCSWFYKGTMDARYVPYTEAVADLLEEEYRRGCETGEWHRRVALPAGESAVLHGPSVMVHLLQGASPDAWGNASEFIFGKKIYRSLPESMSLPPSEGKRIAGLLMMVHGAGCRERKLVQSVMRPRVVRRGVEASEIEEGEPPAVDHLLLLCHGIGSACDLRFRPVEEVVDDFRAMCLQLIQSHYGKSYDSGKVGRIEVLPVSWHSTLHSGERGVDARLAAVTLDSIPRLRGFTNDTVLDVLFYTSPVFCQTIMDTVGEEMNRIYELFVSRNPRYGGGVSLGGHSLGSLILFDLLCHQRPTENADPLRRAKPPPGLVGSAGTGQPYITYPQLRFQPRALYALGSPIAIFECIRGVDLLGEEFALPTCPKFFNIFHPYDPIAYRIEPLINPALKSLPPLLIPHHKGRKRMHLELKETMARVGADLRQRLSESLRGAWASVWRAPQPTAERHQVIEEQPDKEEEEAARDATPETADGARLGRLNGGRRVDRVLQEAPFEIFNEYLFAMTSHVCYWESEDTMLLMLSEMYGELGVEPDTRVPQQTLSVEVERPAPAHSEAARDGASTSRSPL